jgi:excisionase family DNA binding protein
MELDDHAKALLSKPVIDLWPDAGKLLGLGRDTTYNAARSGEIPTLRIGWKWKVPTAKLRVLLGLSDNETPAA